MKINTIFEHRNNEPSKGHLENESTNGAHFVFFCAVPILKLKLRWFYEVRIDLSADL